MKLRGLLLILMSALSSSACTQGTKFDLADFVLALRNEDAVVTLGGSAPSQSYFSVQGAILKVDGQNVTAFEYLTGATAGAEAQTISSDGNTVGSKPVNWGGTPHFYRRDRIIALYVGSKLETLDLLNRVLGPQIAGR
jgi:hypothetical protein